jgi:hypothetical protein
VTAACLLVTGVVAASPARPASAAPGPGVFLLGDSVLEGARDTLEQVVVPSYPGAVIDAAVCRGLASSCTYTDGPVAPTTGLQEIAANAGRIGDVIVIELGYNDSPSAASIDAALTALTNQDVPLVLWVGLSTLNRPAFGPENDRLKAATGRWPTMRFLDWDAVSHGHPDWFVANDGVGVHLTAAGKTTFVTWLKAQLDAIPGIGIPPPAAQHCSASVAIGAPVAAPAALGETGPDAASGFTGTDPRRLLDSRTGRPLGAGRAIELQVAGRAGVPKTASAAVLNVTAVDPCAAGFLTVFPCGSPAPPLASNIDYVAADVRPSLAVARLGPGGRACIYSMVQTDVVVDLTGWFDTTAGAVPVTAAPARLLDTRSTGWVAAGTAVGVTAAPPGTPGVVLNVTGVDARAPGYLTVWPATADGSCDPAARPGTSSVNVAGREPVANAVMVRTGGQGRVCVFSLSDADVVVDLDGTFVPGGTGALRAATPQRVLDTRTGTGGTAGVVPAGGVVAVTVGPVAGAVLTVTAVQPDDAGFLTVWPAAADGSCHAAARPLASNLNYTPGQVAANLAVTGVGGGRVCIYSFAATHVVADLAATIS